MKPQTLLFSFLLLLTFMNSSEPTIQEICKDEITNLGVCLSYASGKAPLPSAQCCSNIKDIKTQNPVCLCSVILATHKGEATVKQMGVQEDKLLKLPSACKLTNASIAECPRLLHLKPGSPDAAAFTNTSSQVSNSSPVPGTPLKDDKSIGMHEFRLAGINVITAGVAVFVIMFFI